MMSIDVFNSIAKKEFIRIHGPEHHILDGASLLTAFYNAGGNIDLVDSLHELMRRGLQMPGATCGMWGVCGAVTSMGAALYSLSQVGGPRCCKRDAYLSYQKAIKYINENYNVELEYKTVECSFNDKNEQCIKGKCPFYKKIEKNISA